MKATLENGIVIELTQEQLAQIDKQRNKDVKTKEQRFLELISGIDVHQPKVDFQKYPNLLFWFDKDGNYVCEYDWKNNHFWFSYSNVWSVFESEFALNYQEIRMFLNGMVEEHFKLEGVTTKATHAAPAVAVEEHFKLEGVTTKSDPLYN
jgi:hypothetical protein